MIVSLQKAVSLFLAGTNNPNSVVTSEPAPTVPTQTELDDFETTLENYKKSQKQSYKFSSPLLNLKTDLNTTQGQFRFIGLGVISSLFSGIGAGLFNKSSILPGIVLASLTPIVAALKNTPLLATKFAIDSFGGNLIRNTLHIFDSIFSRTGEEAANYKVPSLFAGVITASSVVRSLTSKANQLLRLPIDTLCGTFGRTSIHAMDSLFSTSGIKLFQKNQALGSFLASFLSTSGFMLPEKIKQKKLNYEVAENLITIGSTSFTDSIFSSIGNVLSSKIDNSKKLVFGVTSIFAGMPLVGKLLNKTGYEIPFSTLEGRLTKSALHLPESFAFNLGNVVGNSALGIPLALGFSALSYFSYLTKRGEDLIKNILIPDKTLGSQFQRIPFIHFLWSMISASGVKISSLIPAPLLVVIGPMLSFKLGERFKNISARFNETKGLMIRSSIHLLETILMRAGFKTGKMLTGNHEEEVTSGSLLSGYWLTDEGRMVPNMAIGKQMKGENENNLFSTLSSTVFGVFSAICVFRIGRHFMKQEKSPIRLTKPIQESVGAYHGKPLLEMAEV